jgi:hypothetical protein
VYFPRGTYLITSEIVLDAHNTFTNVGSFGGQEFAGDGLGKSIVRQTTNAANGFRVTGGSQSAYIHFRDFTLEGPSAQTSNGIGIFSDLPLNLVWQIHRLDLRYWEVGLKGPMVQLLMDSCHLIGNETHVWLEAEDGVGVNRNTIRHCPMAPLSDAGKSPIVPHTGIRIDAGYGHIIDGLDAGGPYMNRIIYLTGISSGVIRGLSCEIYGTVGSTTSVIDGSGVGTSYWSVEDCTFTMFSSPQAGDYPILKGQYLTLRLGNLQIAGSWPQGLVRAQSSILSELYPVESMGRAWRIDNYNTTTSAIVDSYYSSAFGTRGPGALTASASFKGRLLTDLRQGGEDDKLLFGLQTGPASYALDNLNQYNSDRRAGKFRNLGDTPIDTSGVTVTASAGSDIATVIDGNPATFWNKGSAANVGSPWLKFDFGASYSPIISRVRYLPQTIGEMQVVVSGSPDNSTWTEVGRFKTKTIVDGSYPINPTIGYRYYRMDFTTSETAWLAVYEVDFWRPIVTGEIVGAETKTYANDAAADADAQLPSGAFYMITGGRTLYRKP